jgi:hypothetical protein
MSETDGQVTFADLGIWFGKTSPELSAPATEKISGLSSKKSAELLTAPYLYLDLQTGHGSLLGPLWEINSPSLGEYWMLNTGPSHSGAAESSLSQILEAKPHPKYYLSPTACRGILRRARVRGKELPAVLKKALELQAMAKPE